MGDGAMSWIFVLGFDCLHNMLENVVFLCECIVQSLSLHVHVAATLSCSQLVPISPRLSSIARKLCLQSTPPFAANPRSTANLQPSTPWLVTSAEYMMRKQFRLHTNIYTYTLAYIKAYRRIPRHIYTYVCKYSRKYLHNFRQPQTTHVTGSGHVLFLFGHHRTPQGGLLIGFLLSMNEQATSPFECRNIAILIDNVPCCRQSSFLMKPPCIASLCGEFLHYQSNHIL